MTLTFVLLFVSFASHQQSLTSCCNSLQLGPDVDAWYNEFFVRGCPHEIKNMIRIKIKGTFPAKSESSASFNDMMTSVPPLGTTLVNDDDTDVSLGSCEDSDRLEGTVLSTNTSSMHSSVPNIIRSSTSRRVSCDELDHQRDTLRSFTEASTQKWGHGEVPRNYTSEMEPLPFQDKLPTTDDFAKFIDDTIHVL